MHDERVASGTLSIKENIADKCNRSKNADRTKYSFKLEFYRISHQMLSVYTKFFLQQDKDT